MTDTPAQPRPPLVLEPVGESVSRARRFVRECLGALGRDDLDDCAELGVSELVTNSALHARTSIVIAVVRTRDGTVRIEVTDGSPLMPVIRRHARTATTGRGLRLLAACGRWGAAARSDGKSGKTVWFEPAASMSPIAFPVGAASGEE